MTNFVATLKKEADRVVQRVDDVRKKREKPPVHKEVELPPIPDDYWSYAGIGKKKRRTKGKKSG